MRWEPVGQPWQVRRDRAHLWREGRPSQRARGRRARGRRRRDAEARRRHHPEAFCLRRGRGASRRAGGRGDDLRQRGGQSAPPDAGGHEGAAAPGTGVSAMNTQTPKPDGKPGCRVPRSAPVLACLRVRTGLRPSNVDPVSTCRRLSAFDGTRCVARLPRDRRNREHVHARAFCGVDPAKFRRGLCRGPERAPISATDPPPARACKWLDASLQCTSFESGSHVVVKSAFDESALHTHPSRTKETGNAIIHASPNLNARPAWIEVNFAKLPAFTITW